MLVECISHYLVLGEIAHSEFTRGIVEADVCNVNWIFRRRDGRASW